MELEIKETKEFTPEQLRRLFLSVNWESARHAEKLARGMRNSDYVVSAWDKDKVAGLIRVLSDGETLAFIHYVLVDPDYQKEHVGDRLMRKVMDHYKDVIYIKLDASSKKAVPFFQKYGLQEYDYYTHMEIKRV